jgi:autotransporter-associated beta strand protein
VRKEKKMKIKYIPAFFVFFFASLFGLALLSNQSVSAAAVTCTWTGGDAGNSNTDDVDNWSNCESGVPGSDDAVVFPAAATDVIVDNNISGGWTVASIEFQKGGYVLRGQGIFIGGVNNLSVTGTPGSDDTNLITAPLFVTSDLSLDIATGYILQIDADVDLGVSNLILDPNADAFVDIMGIVSNLGGTNSITKTSPGTASLSGINTYDGNTIVTDGVLEIYDESALGTADGYTSISGSGTLLLSIDGEVTIAEPIYLDGAGFTSRQTLEATGTGAGLTLSGDITLYSSTVEIGSDLALTLSGVLSSDTSGDGFTFVDNSGDGSGSLKLTGDNTYDGITTVSGIVAITGDQGSSDVSVTSGGFLKGTGTVGDVTVLSGGHVAPGLSPGCLNAGNTTFASGSNFDVEIAGTNGTCPGSEYDKLVVTGTIDLGSATLNLSLLNGFVPTVGQTYTIVSSSGALSGTFSQGNTITSNGVTYSITYSANSVVLTVTAVAANAGAAAPSVPATGLKLVAAHPAAALGLSILAAGGLLLTARRLSPAVARR